jgi:hypothetical protein
VSKCRSCGAPVIWTITEGEGKTMPVDAEPVEDGNIRLEERGQKTNMGTPAPTAIYDTTESLFGSSNRYVSHFATCPEATQWRKENA